MEILLLAFGGIVAALLVAARPAERKRVLAAGGARVRSELEAVYAPEHVYQRVDASDVAGVDHAWFDEVARELEPLGFARVADVEDVTLTELHPEGRGYVRWFSEGGIVRASAHWIGPRGGVIAVLGLVQIRPHPLRVVELVTEFPDGTLLSTSNTLGLERLEVHPKVQAVRLPAGGRLKPVIEAHQQRVAEAMRRRPEHLPVAVETYEGVLASVQRVHRLAAEHRQAQQGISREELQRLRGRRLDAMDEAFLRGVQGDRKPGDSG